MKPFLSSQSDKRYLTRAVAVACVFFAASSPALSQGLNDDPVARGLVLARAWCMTCHVIGEENQPSALDGAPSFPSLAQRPDFSTGMLAVALLRPHPVMPKMELSRRDVRALAAYIEQLK